jgi:hypothetical protein
VKHLSSSSIARFLLARSLVLGLIWIWSFGLPGEIRAGEKIKISESDGKIELPSKSQKDDILSKPFDFLKSRGDGDGGSLAPSLPPPFTQRGSLRKDKPEEKHWIQGTSEKFDQEAVLKEIFKIREYDLESLAKKPESSLSGILESDGNAGDKPSEATAPGDPLTSHETTPMGRSNVAHRNRTLMEEDSFGSTTPNSELNLNQLLNPNQMRDPLATAPAGMMPAPFRGRFEPMQNRATPLQNGRSRERELRSQEFDKLLGTRKSFLSPLNDSINSQTDSTRQEMNPITGRKMGENGSAINPPGVSDSLTGLNGSSRNPLTGFTDSLNMRAPGGSSLAPAFTPPPVTPVSQPKQVFEIPRRKF